MSCEPVIVQIVRAPTVDNFGNGAWISNHLHQPVSSEARKKKCWPRCSRIDVLIFDDPNCRQEVVDSREGCAQGVDQQYLKQPVRNLSQKLRRVDPGGGGWTGAGWPLQR